MCTCNLISCPLFCPHRQHKKSTGDLVSFSEQQLVDCNLSNNGCHGGWMSKAFDYIKNAGGIEKEGTYTYQARCV